MIHFKKLNILQKKLITGSQHVGRSFKHKRSQHRSQTESRITRNGFTFIEMMIALTLLATFGTSLFLMQTNILSKVFNTHRLVMYSGDVVQELLNLNMKLKQTVLQKKSLDTIKIETKKKNPERTITVTMKQISEASSLYKSFGKQVRLVQTTITHDQYKDVWYSFEYIPELNEKTNSAKSQTEIPKEST